MKDAHVIATCMLETIFVRLVNVVVSKCQQVKLNKLMERRLYKRILTNQYSSKQLIPEFPCEIPNFSHICKYAKPEKLGVLSNF